MSKESPSSKMLDSSKVIGTHNGAFHCDEVFACYLLKQLPTYRNSKIVRTRDPTVLNSCDIVVDVGGVFDHSKFRYDHHQRDFSYTFNNLRSDKPWSIKLSSAGLIYLHYGEQILSTITGLATDDVFVQKIYDLLYENFVMEIDAIDNGIAGGPDQLYRVHTGISARVGYLNPWWNRPEQQEDQQFEKAMELVGSEFMEKINYYQNCWWPARSAVQKSIDNRLQVDSSGRIINLGADGGFPWKGHLWDLESELSIPGEIVFALYSDNNGNWRVQTVPPDEHRQFESRIALPEQWRGYRDNQLSELSGIPDCVFVHATGFIGGNKTYEGALRMAQLTLALSKEPNVKH